MWAALALRKHGGLSFFLYLGIPNTNHWFWIFPPGFRFAEKHSVNGWCSWSPSERRRCITTRLRTCVVCRWKVHPWALLKNHHKNHSFLKGGKMEKSGTKHLSQKSRIFSTHQRVSLVHSPRIFGRWAKSWVPQHFIGLEFPTDPQWDFFRMFQRHSSLFSSYCRY